jgi:hypothetical protein
MGFWLIAIAVITWWAFRASRKHRQRVREAWAAAASRLNLEFDPGSLTRRKSLNGYIDGNRVEVETFTRNSGSKSSHAVTRYRVHYPKQLASGLQIKPRGLLSDAAAFFGAQNIQTGDAGFDSRVVVKGDYANRVAGFLTPERRREVIRLLDGFKGVKIDHQNIEWSKSGVAKDPAEIVEIVRQLSSAAATLSSDTPGAALLEEVAVPVATAAAAELFMDPSGAKPISVEAPAGLRGREVSAIATVAAAAAAAGAAAVAALDTAPERAPTAALFPTAAPPPAADTGLAVADVCAQLFTRSITSTEAKKRFEERYKGQRVRWSGNLRRAATYSIDLVFKGGPGTKATFALPVPTEGALGGSVQAVVQLSPAAAEQLKKRVGEEITFEGRLLSFDGMVRNFNIADATLT